MMILADIYVLIYFYSKPYLRSEEIGFRIMREYYQELIKKGE